jgi:hypothetical protein
MYPYYVYAKDSGCITKTMVLPSEEDLLLQLVSSDEMVGAGYADIYTNFVRDGELLTLTPEQSAVYKSQFWRRHEFDFVAMQYPESEESRLESAKLQKWEYIKQCRASTEFSPIIVTGHVFDADSISQQRIAGAVQLALLAESDFSINWTLADNTSVELPRWKLLHLGKAVGQRTSYLFQYAQVLRQQIDASETVEAVEAVVWSPILE